MAKATILKRKEQITKVAQTLFRERGYNATSMRDLATAIGIEPASLYSHIRSKEEILQTICFQIANKLFAAVEGIETSNLPPDKKLKKAITAHINVIKDNVDASAIFINDWQYLSEPYLNKFKLLRKKYENIFKKIIQEGIEKNVFKNIDEKITFLTIFSALNWSYNWYKASGSITPEGISENLSNLILKGLKK